MSLYFAYGSNLCIKRLEDRRVSPILYGSAYVEGHRILFNKASLDGSAKANIQATEDGDIVWGALISIPGEKISRLDKIEVGYDRIDMIALGASGLVDVFTYVARVEFTNNYLLPYDWYKNHLVFGARELGFPSEYVAALEGVPSKADPDVVRAARERGYWREFL